MAKYTVEEITSKEVWERFVLSESQMTFLQSWNWGEVNRLTGSKIFRLGFKEDNKLVGICLLVKEDAKRGPRLVVSGGPLIDWNNPSLVRFFIQTIKDLAIKEKSWFVRVRPELVSTPKNIKLFERLGFISAPMHLHAENTWILDISKPEEMLLAEMRKTTRYLIRKSGTSGLTLEITKDSSFASLLHKLQGETIERHNFVGFSEAHFKTEIETFAKDDNAALFICRSGKKALAAAIIIFYKDSAFYHYSGSTSAFPKIPFSYFLQWEIIKEAKRRGMKYYNFWGIAPNDNPKHRFAGVTIFKTGFGGFRIDWLHAHDLPVSPLYWLTYIFETVRKYFRHL